MSDTQLSTQDIVEFVTDNAYPMSDFQCQQFVINSHVTTYRQVRQALMEVEARTNNINKMTTDLKKLDVQRRMMERDLSNEEDELKRELIQIDLEVLNDNIKVIQKNRQTFEIERERFAKFIKDTVPEKETLKLLKDNNEEEERKYWIMRLGKQAALDIIANGRVATGNMDAIMMLPQSEQINALHVALSFSKSLTQDMVRLDQSISSQPLLTQAERFDKESVQRLLNNLQNGDQSAAE